MLVTADTAESHHEANGGASETRDGRMRENV
jgi:hypothetical protein